MHSYNNYLYHDAFKALKTNNNSLTPAIYTSFFNNKSSGFSVYVRTRTENYFLTLIVS